MRHQIKLLQSTIAMTLVNGKGILGMAHPNQPEKLLELYDMEACPYCRRVRLALTRLNLDFIVYPCPKNGTLYRKNAIKISGQSMFPLLVDPNTGVQLLQSQEIIEYLFNTYSDTGEIPASWQYGEKDFKGTLMTAISMLRGLRADKHNKKRIKNNEQPEQLLELYSFENSPYSRLIRERLCELELPYICRNLAKERWQDLGHAKLRFRLGKYEPLVGGKRDRIMTEVMKEKMQVPFLIDPNTGVSMFESKKILAYLNKQYVKNIDY